MTIKQKNATGQKNLLEKKTTSQKKKKEKMGEYITERKR